MCNIRRAILSGDRSCWILIFDNKQAGEEAGLPLMTVMSTWLFFFFFFNVLVLLTERKQSSFLMLMMSALMITQPY